MKMQDIIRSILDLIDQVERSKEEVVVVSQPEEPGQLSPFSNGDDINRFRQIVDLANQPNPCAEYSNTPNEKYADIDSVTVHAGGGINGPKHPHDLRVKDPSMYPNQQEF